MNADKAIAVWLGVVLVLCGLISCTTSSNSQASDPSIGTYLGMVGNNRVYQIKSDGMTCVLAERFSYSPAVSCVRL